MNCNTHTHLLLVANFRGLNSNSNFGCGSSNKCSSFWRIPPLIGEGSVSTTNASLAKSRPLRWVSRGGMLGHRIGSGSGFESGLIDGFCNGDGGVAVARNGDGSIEEAEWKPWALQW